MAVTDRRGNLLRPLDKSHADRGVFSFPATLRSEDQTILVIIAVVAEVSTSGTTQHPIDREKRFSIVCPGTLSRDGIGEERSVSGSHVSDEPEYSIYRPLRCQ